MGEKGKDSIMKLLLSGGTGSSNASSYLNSNSPKVGSPRFEMGEDNHCKLSSILHQMAGYPISKTCTDMDHPYSRPWNWRAENLYTKPLKTLFVFGENSSELSSDVEIEVNDIDEKPSLPYDINKARSQMDECERHVGTLHVEEGDPAWEEHISRIGWSTMQNRIFNKVVRVLHHDYLARAAHKGAYNEPILRRVTVDKTARLLRQIFGSVSWDVKYTQWLHTILIDNLNSAYLVVYLEALQTLKSKVPSLVERMISTNNMQRAISAPPIHETISIVHKRPWDPMSLIFPQFKTRRLPNDPILVMVPSGPGSGFAANSRSHHWMANLSTLSTVICVYASVGRPHNKVNIPTCLDQMLAATRAKLAEVRTDYGKKPIILIGTNTGAALACQVALVENVAAVVCLGFPLNTVEGKRGQPDDFLLNIQVPVLFVIGQNSATTTVDEIEELRDKMKVETSLIVVGSADDQLRISKTKKKQEGITQSMLDKCILDELSDFLGNLMIAPYQPPIRQSSFHHSSLSETSGRKNVVKLDRKRKLIELKSNDNTSDGMGNKSKKGRKPKMLMSQVGRNWTSSNNQHSSTSVTTQSPESNSRISMSQASQSAVGAINIGNLATIHSSNIRSSERKSVQISIQGTSIVRQPQSENSTITVIASSPAVINQVTSNTEKDGTKPKSSINSESNLVEELTPDKILELPVFLEDQQIEAPESPVKVIISNKKLLTKTQKLKPAIPAVKYIKKPQQQIKYTQIVLTKKDSGHTTGPESMFMGEIGEVIGNSNND